MRVLIYDSKDKRTSDDCKSINHLTNIQEFILNLTLRGRFQFFGYAQVSAFQYNCLPFITTSRCAHFYINGVIKKDMIRKSASYS